MTPAALTSIGPIEVDFPLADGTITKRKPTAACRGGRVSPLRP
jgi:hypothetical protein